MAGITDQPFRNLCRDHGAYWLVSEMITADRRLWTTTKSRNRLRFDSEPGPRWVQIAGADPLVLAEAAMSCERSGAQIIDINMGCPAKKVCNKAAGSALMRDEKLVDRILNAVVSAVQIPVTLKIRLGWSLAEQNAMAIAKIAEQAGVQLVTVHGRSRACKFAGLVDYDAIAEVVHSVKIPVIANGDIDSASKADAVISHTGAAAVMIGRAIRGRPWMVNQIDHYLKSGELKKNPDSSEVKNILITHIGRLGEFYGQTMGPRIARKHVTWYFQASAQDSRSRGFMKEFNRLTNTKSQIQAVEKGFEKTCDDGVTSPVLMGDIENGQTRALSGFR